MRTSSFMSVTSTIAVALLAASGVAADGSKDKKLMSRDVQVDIQPQTAP